MVTLTKEEFSSIEIFQCLSTTISGKLFSNIKEKISRHLCQNLIVMYIKYTDLFLHIYVKIGRTNGWCKWLLYINIDPPNNITLREQEW